MRVLRNHNRNIILELQRSRKWSIVVVHDGTGYAKKKFTNDTIDRDWSEFEYDVKKAIKYMIAPILSTTDPELKAELRQALKGVVV